MHPVTQQVGQNFSLQQDNAGAHTSWVVVNHLAQNGISHGVAFLFTGLEPIQTFVRSAEAGS